MLGKPSFNIMSPLALSDNLKSIWLMIIAMALGTLADMFLKLAANDVTVGQVTLAVGLGGTLLYWVILKRQGQRLFSKVFFEGPVLLRTGGDILTTLSIVLALTYASFSSVIAIMQTSPLLLTLVSFVFLGERVGVHRLTAVVLGFIGVLIIIRPGTESFNVYSLLGIVVVIGMTMRDLGSRLAASHHSSARLAVYGTLGQIVAGCGLMLFEPVPTAISLTTATYMVALVVLACVAIMMITSAMRIGDVSLVSPFRYTRLLFGVIVGVLVFKDRLDGYMLTGCAMILLSGLYVWYRERLTIKAAEA